MANHLKENDFHLLIAEASSNHWHVRGIYRDMPKRRPGNRAGETRPTATQTAFLAPTHTESYCQEVGLRSRTRPHFLVAEDTPSQQTLMAAFIESIGGSALIVNNGDAALRWATVERYAGLIIDLNMPKVTGDAVLRRMRETPGPNQSTPAMLWTAATLPPARRTALEEISSLTIKIKPLGLRDFRRWVNASVLPADEQLNGQSNSSV